jgi:uncharacterized membrane protein
MSKIEKKTFLEKQEEQISPHIFAVSASFVGVCLTVLGLISINQNLRKIQGIADELISIDAFLFLIACFISYVAMRIKGHQRRYHYERFADYIFLTALTLAGVISLVIIKEFV